MNVHIDGKEIEIFADDNNIVEIAKRVGIGIPAPCYYDNRKGGCCKACLIEINGEEKYACCTKPIEGMNIVFKRQDLDNIRKERLMAYKAGKNGGCNCNCNSNSNSDCC